MLCIYEATIEWNFGGNDFYGCYEIRLHTIALILLLTNTNAQHRLFGNQINAEYIALYTLYICLLPNVGNTSS